jgi:PadR family transcriptional regulator PadR
MSVFCTVGGWFRPDDHRTGRAIDSATVEAYEQERMLLHAGRIAPLSRFESAPPRNFILPALLLLVSERPGYGYELVPRAQSLGLDHVDRPAVYRALSQLEADGLVLPSSQNPKAGQARRVYRITPLGERVLREWMGVVKEEHDHLGRVLRRYLATGTTDSVLAEVEGGWSSALGAGWSSVSTTSANHRRLEAVVERGPPPDRPAAPPGSDDRAGAAPSPQSRRFRLIPDRSAILIDVRSTVGPLSFGAIGVSGTVDATVVDGAVHPDGPASAALEVDLTGLRSGNSLYDAELLRRIEAHRYPVASVELLDCVPSDADSRYLLQGRLTFHRVSRAVQGTIRVSAGPGGHLVITGEQVFDIRDFAIPSPTVLMLRIFPDVRVHLHAEAEPEDAP